MNLNVLYCTAIIPLLFISPCDAQSPTPTPVPAPAANPETTASTAPGATALSQDILTFKVYAGLQTQLRGPRNTDFTHRVEYKGKPVGKQGADLSFLDVTGEFGKPGLDEKTDSPSLAINFEKGEGVSQDGLLDFLKLNPNGFPFKFKPLKSYPFRTATQAGANFQAKTYSIAFGLETPSLKLSQIGIGDGTSLSNWLTFGVAANQKWRPVAAGGDKFSGILTYRGFVGKAWGFRRVKELAFSLDDVFATAPNFARLAAWDAATRGAERNQLGLNIFFDALWNRQDMMDAATTPTHRLHEEGVYRAFVIDQYERELASTYERDPSLSLHLESAGWYNMQSVINERKLNSGTSLALTKWFSAGKSIPRSSIQLRLDYGRSFANTTQPQRTASAVFGLNF